MIPENDKEEIIDIATSIHGPEHGYVSTPILIVTLAKMALERRGDMPRGGVVTPGAAYFNILDDTIQQLRKEGISFQVDDM